MAAAPTTDFPSAGGKRGPLIALGAALLVAGAGAAAYFALRPGPQAAAPALAPVEPPAEASAPPAPSPASAPPVAPAKVLIEVQTEPAGADVLIDGEPACSPTPCTLSAERDSVLKLTAELAGHRPGTTELRADDDHKLIKLTLKKRATLRRTEPAEGELMIPDAFARPRRR